MACAPSLVWAPWTQVAGGRPPQSVRPGKSGVIRSSFIPRRSSSRTEPATRGTFFTLVTHVRDHRKRASRRAARRRPVLLGLSRQVTLPGVQNDCLVVNEVVHENGVGHVMGKRAVAPVGDRPDGAKHGRGAVSTTGSELPVGAGMQKLERPARGGRRR